jgi:hypothetical protein
MYCTYNVVDPLLRGLPGSGSVIFVMNPDPSHYEQIYNMVLLTQIFSLGHRHILFYILKTFFNSHAVYQKIFPRVGDFQYIRIRIPVRKNTGSGPGRRQFLPNLVRNIFNN